MAKNFAGENTIAFMMSLIKAEENKKINKTDIVNNLTSADSDKVLSAAQGKALADQIAGAGYGDMLKSVYDTDNDGVVDNAKKLNGHDDTYFAKSDDPEKYVTSIKGQSNGLAPLDGTKKINSVYLPSYVDDVIEGYYDSESGVFYEDEAHVTSIVGERGKIYIDLSSDVSYRWSGSKYAQITSSDMVEISNEEVQQLWDSIT